METKDRKKKTTNEYKLPTTCQTYIGNHQKGKVKKRTTIQTHKNLNVDKNKNKKEIKDKKSKTEVKTNVINVVQKIENEKVKEYIPYSCIPNLESGKDLTINDKTIQK